MIQIFIDKKGQPYVNGNNLFPVRMFVGLLH